MVLNQKIVVTLWHDYHDLILGEETPLYIFVILYRP